MEFYCWCARERCWLLKLVCHRVYGVQGYFLRNVVSKELTRCILLCFVAVVGRSAVTVTSEDAQWPGAHGTQSEPSAAQDPCAWPLYRPPQAGHAGAIPFWRLIGGAGHCESEGEGEGDACIHSQACGVGEGPQPIPRPKHRCCDRQGTVPVQRAAIVRRDVVGLISGAPGAAPPPHPCCDTVERSVGDEARVEAARRCDH